MTYTATIAKLRAYCGRCAGPDPFGELEQLGDGRWVIHLSPRWTTREEVPEVWRRAAHNRTRSRSAPSAVHAESREPGRWQKLKPWPALPIDIICPRCSAPNRVNDPSKVG